MSFAPEEKAVLCEIVDLSPQELDSIILYLESGYSFVQAIEDSIRVDIVAWPAIRDAQYVNLESTDSNFGVNLTGSAQVYDLKNRVKNKLGLGSSGGGDYTRLVRA